MNRERFISLREGRTTGGILAGVAGTVLLSNALSYVWLFLEEPLLFRIWGFTFLSAGLAGLPFVLWAYRIHTKDLSRIRELFGQPRHWFAAFLIPLLIAAAVVGWEWQNGPHPPDPGWKWITYASSALLDVPLVFLWTLPMLLLFELSLRQSFALFPSGTGRGARGVWSSFSSLASCAVLVYFLSKDAPLETAVSYCLLAFGLGFFSYRLQEAGAIVISSLAVLITATVTFLIIGCEIPEINTVLFGYDVDKVASLLHKKSAIFSHSLGIIGLSLLLLALPITPKNTTD